LRAADGGYCERSSGALLSIFSDRLKLKGRFIGVRIDDKEDVYPALRQFFGRRGVEARAPCSRRKSDETLRPVAKETK